MRSQTQIIQFGTAWGGHLGHQVAEQIAGSRAMPGPTIVTKWGLEPSEAETAAAAGELPESAGGWTHLLAEAAGLLLGFHEGGPGCAAGAGRCRLLHRGWCRSGRDPAVDRGGAAQGRGREDASAQPVWRYTAGALGLTLAKSVTLTATC